MASSLLNKQLFVRDPATSQLMNNGQARIADGLTERELLTLREELGNFVCKGQYADGMRRILESFIAHAGSTSQPAAWVSGFYGSGKSHLLKMLCHLWQDTEFPTYGDTARSLVPKLPDDITDALKELDTLGRQSGGLHAASGTLPSGGSGSVRLTVLSIILRSLELPTSYAQVRFCLYLKDNGFYEQVKGAVEAAGKDFFKELNNLYVSPVLHDALIGVDSAYGDRKSARDTVKQEFKQPIDIDTAEFIRMIREVLSDDEGKLPTTMLVLDEVQAFIADDTGRAKDVAEIAEALCKHLDSRLMLVGAGQTAMAGQIPQFGWLKGRFTIPVELSDLDTETVTRDVLLAKNPQHVNDIKAELELHDGEIKRQLQGTQISSRTEDETHLIDDYPVLPVRRRFWEECLRALDPAGTSSMLRTQLQIINDALRRLADKPLRTVVPGDYIFEQLHPGLLSNGVLLKELDETIRGLEDGTPDGLLAKRLCGLIFMVRKLPREAGADKGVRATPDMLADLMVSDLKDDGATLRKDIPRVLNDLEERGILLNDHGEYNLQTKEYAEWDKEFRNRFTRMTNQPQEVHHKREALLRDEALSAVKGIKLQHGQSRVPRKVVCHFGEEPPQVAGHDIPVWVRDGWDTTEKTVVDAARAAGTDSPIVFIFIPKANSEELKTQIIRSESAQGTIEFKGPPSTPEGDEAKNAMRSRLENAKSSQNELIARIVDHAKVYKGGGTEQLELTVTEKANSACKDGLDRLFPRFADADHKNWPVVIARAKSGSDSPLEPIDWTGPVEQHPVCRELMHEIGADLDGKSIRKKFEDSPFGWPRDAIDGALIALHTTGHVTAAHASTPLSVGQLDHNKIAKTKFRIETITLSGKDKLKLRGLFQEAGLSAKSSDDLNAKASEFLDKLEHLGERAGGEAPLPERPKMTHLADLRSLAGNERLSEVLAKHDELKSQITKWREAAELTDKRLPVWRNLDRFLKHSNGIDDSEELQKAARGVTENRLLLDTTDHVTSLVKKIAGSLRSAIKAAHANFEEIHTAESQRIASLDAWQKIDNSDRQGLLRQAGIDGVPKLEVASDDELLSTLDRTPLTSWRDKTDAVSGRFSKAAAEAARLIEPKTQPVHLTSSSLHTTKDVEAWIEETKKELLERIDNGPVVIG